VGSSPTSGNRSVNGNKKERKDLFLCLYRQININANINYIHTNQYKMSGMSSDFIVQPDPCIDNKYCICPVYTAAAAKNTHIINSILHIHTHPDICTEMYQLAVNPKTQSITFYAESVQPFCEFIAQNTQKFIIDYSLSLNTAKILCAQLEYLLNCVDGEKMGFAQFNSQNMIIVNHTTIFYMGASDLVSMDSGGPKSELQLHRPQFTTFRPYKCSGAGNTAYQSPEIINIVSVPCVIPYQACFWSLALFISAHLIPDVKTMNGKNKNERKRLYSPTTMNRLLDESDICETPLFYFLKRCFKRHPKHRVLVL
jgi:hypothetical protein